MNSCRRIFRHLRYRIYRNLRCLQTCFTLTNLVLGMLIFTMCSFVLILQKLENPYSIDLLTNSKRREILVTTAKMSLRKKSIECNKIESIIAELEANVLSDTNKNHPRYKKTRKRPFRYSPAIRSFRSSKSLQQFSNSSYEITPRVFQSLATQEKILNEPKRQIFNTVESLETKVANTEFSSKDDGKDKDKWLRINSGLQKALAFSAYWDDRSDSRFVRVMAILVTKSSPIIYCRLHLPTDNKCYDVTATKKAINEHWRLKYTSYIISCPLHKDDAVPTHVTLSTTMNFSVSATLRVHNNKNDTVSPQGSIAVCVKPFHYNYDRATWLLEFLELHRMFGVDHFFFYNHSVGPHVEKVLRTYMSMNLVTIFQWETGIKTQKEIRTEALFSSLNDCIYRTMFLFDYAILLDFDEYIIPREHLTYVEMLEKLEKTEKLRGKPGSFIFRNAFFYLYWENDTTIFGVLPEKPPDCVPYLLTQYKTRRLISTMKYGSRSKYIVKPDRAIEAGNHVIWKHTPGSKAVKVPETMGLLHHYRICEFGGYSCLKKKSAVDHAALRFGLELLDLVRHQCELAFKSDGGRCPVSPPLGSPW